MMTADQLWAARALIDQRELAAVSGLSLATIARMQASDGGMGADDPLMKLIGALHAIDIEQIADRTISQEDWARRATQVVEGDRKTVRVVRRRGRRGPPAA